MSVTITIPTGLEEVILDILQDCKGVDNSISRLLLISCANQSPHLKDLSDRQIRKAVENLRSQGHPICSNFERGGYFMPSTPQEYITFKEKYTSYARTIFTHVKAMDATIDRTWPGMGRQGKLF
jgi:hypothetical protein